MNDTLTLNIGGRYTWERKAVQVSTLRPNGCNLDTLICATNFTDSDKWKGFTPKIGLQWQPSEDTQVYGLYTRGLPQRRL